jgi:hypothetical protein
MAIHRIAASVLPLVILAVTGCVRRDGRNSDSKWPGEPTAKRLQRDQPSDMRHLRGDIEFAEELAIEYMDAHRGPRSGTSNPPQSDSEELNTCLARLLQQIAKSHGVSRTEIIENFGRRSVPIAVGEHLPFVLLYLFLSVLLVDKVIRRYPPDDGLAVGLVMIFLASLAAGIGGALSVKQLADLLEAIRVGNGHMSYRADRVPWAHYQASLFGLCFALFWVIAAVRLVRATGDRSRRLAHRH